MPSADADEADPQPTDACYQSKSENDEGNSDVV